MASNEIWYQLVVKDADELSGESVYRLMTLIINSVKIKTVVTTDLVGSIKGLHGAEGKNWNAEDFLLRVGKATQYDWAFFYMFGEDLSVGPNIANGMALLKCSDITVRLADNTYFYIYSLNEALINILKSYYPHGISSAVPFGKLEILY